MSRPESNRGARRSPTVVALAFVSVIAAAPAAPVRADSTPLGAGLWAGAIVYEPASIEAELVLEIAPGSDGVWAGTVDVPSLHLERHPLESVQAAQGEIALEFVRKFPGVGREIGYTLRGKVTPDGQTLRGELVEGPRPPFPLTLHRLGPAGMERSRAPERRVTELTAGAAELAARFDADRDKVRLLMLLSPTCGRCAIAAFVLGKYLLDTVEDDRLAVYVVWGPMLGDESLEAARAATPRLSDPRVSHFWAPGQDLAIRAGSALGLDAEPAWKSFLLFAPGVGWSETLPAPSAFMHIGLPLPEGRSFRADLLADEVRALLDDRGRSDG